MALVFCLCLGNYLYAKIMSKIVVEQGTDTTPTSYYALCAFTYLTAMVSSNKALLWVNYPTQVIGKSCKPIPVMILGKLVAISGVFICLQNQNCSPSGRKLFPKIGTKNRPKTKVLT